MAHRSCRSNKVSEEARLTAPSAAMDLAHAFGIARSTGATAPISVAEAPPRNRALRVDGRDIVLAIEDFIPSPRIKSNFFWLKGTNLLAHARIALRPAWMPALLNRSSLTFRMAKTTQIVSSRVWQIRRNYTTFLGLYQTQVKYAETEPGIDWQIVSGRRLGIAD